MHKSFLKMATWLGAITVVLGAFSAHELREKLSADVFQIFETAVRYQFYHVFALLAAGILFESFPNNKILWSGRLFIAGVVLFCGSLYLLTYLKASENESMTWVGAITPIGGLCFIAGWIYLALGIAVK
jgi:uncharacterized membrane protein YgdD (TMEM256/DUF423 family)